MAGDLRIETMVAGHRAGGPARYLVTPSWRRSVTMSK